MFLRETPSIWGEVVRDAPPSSRALAGKILLTRALQRCRGLFLITAKDTRGRRRSAVQRSWLGRHSNYKDTRQ